MIEFSIGTETSTTYEIDEDYKIKYESIFITHHFVKSISIILSFGSLYLLR